MNREKALELLKEHLKNKNLIKHSLSVEAVMRGFAEYFNEDQEKWGLAGLLHDLDYEKTVSKPETHTIVTEQILKEKGIDNDIISVIKAHNGFLNENFASKAEKIIVSVDPVTGLIVACALIHPDKKLASIDTKFVLNRFKEKSFAAGANREDIKKCEELGISLEKFIEISLKSMQKIAKELEL